MICLDKRLLKTLVLAAGIPALVTACGDDTGTNETPDAGSQIDATPEEEADAGPTGTAIIDEFMKDNIAAKRFSGGVVIVHKEGGETFTQTYGTKGVGSTEDMPKDGLFRLVSLGKTIVSVAAMDMYEEGLFGLDDPISMHLPEWADQTKIVKPDPATPDDPESYAIVPVENEITIRQLLTQTSGLEFTFYGSVPYAGLVREAGVVDGLNLELTNHTLATFSELLAEQPLKHEPGAEWTYGPNLEIMARIMEVVEPDDKPFDQILQERVFDKLGMEDCGFYFDGEDVDRFVPVDLVIANQDTGAIEDLVPFPAETQHFPPPDGFWDINVNYPYDTDLSPRTFFSPSEGLVCTPEDFLKFTRMILNGGTLDGNEVLTEETVELMTSNQIGEDLHAQGNMDYDFGFGFGINVGDSRFNNGEGPKGELDWGGYFNTFFTIDRTNDMITIIFTQSFTGPNFSLQLDFKEAAYKATGIIE